MLSVASVDKANDVRPRSVLVDANDPMIEALTELLEDVGVVVSATARTGAAAHALLQSETPDLAVVALELPDMTGLDFAATATGRELETALILHTGTGSARLADRALASGFRAVARKAIPPTSLIAAVRAVLRGESYVDPSFRAPPTPER
jgi:DNA-binding NarL/FixJ family response regulator